MSNTETPKKGNITVASGTDLGVDKVGTIHFEDAKSKSVIALREYHHVPGLSKEMVSLGKLIEDGWKPEFTQQAIILKKGEASIICKRNVSDGMYYFQGKRTDEPGVNSVETFEQGGQWNDVSQVIDDQGNTTEKVIHNITTMEDINEAHDKMGHKGEALIRKMLKNIGCKVTGNMKSCKGCAYAKAKQRAVSQTTDKRATKPGQRIFWICQVHLMKHQSGANIWFKFWTILLDSVLSLSARKRVICLNGLENK
jgi:hypothetical protein